MPWVLTLIGIVFGLGVAGMVIDVQQEAEASRRYDDVVSKAYRHCAVNTICGALQRGDISAACLQSCMDYHLDGVDK